MILLELFYLLPEISLLILLSLVLILTSILPADKQRISYAATQFSLLVVLFTVYLTIPESRTIVFDGHYVSDVIGSSSKLFIVSLSILILIYTREFLDEHEWFSGEYFVITMFAILGMMILVSAGSLLVIYLGLELLSLSLYALVALNRNSLFASEAAMKYFVLGALASGMLLFGISYLYGVTGTLLISEINQTMNQGQDQLLFISLALVFIIVGLAFKFGAVPFHMWVPDIYQGAPTPVTMLISSTPKIAAVLMTYRILGEGLVHLHADWQLMLSILAALSLILGNFVAIVQKNIKRMMAYSTIGHVGFLLLGILTLDYSNSEIAGFADAVFYSIIYALSTILVFALIILLSRKGFEADQLDDFKGLNEKSPWFAFVMLMVMFSFAGIPPFAGFWAKWFVLSELIELNLVKLACLAIVTSVIAAYYYLRIIKLMYFERAEDLTAIKASQGMRVILIIHGFSLLAIGLYPDALMSVCINALK